MTRADIKAELRRSACEDARPWTCGECGQPIRLMDLACLYEGERCHIDCAARAMDEIGFDRDMED